MADHSHINNTHFGNSNATPNQLIVSGGISWIKWSAEFVVDQILPPNGEAKSVQAIVLHEMLHLLNAIPFAGHVESRTRITRSVDHAAKVETSNVDPSESDLAA